MSLKRIPRLNSFYLEWINMDSINKVPSNIIPKTPQGSDKPSLWTKYCLGIAVASATVASAAFLWVTGSFNKPEDDLLLHHADPNRVMATDIGNYDDIAHLQKINGVAINTLESRARPGAWANSGFLGKKESLLTRLQGDWEIVEALGTTHIELADHLAAIRDLTGEQFINLIVYDPSKIQNNTISRSSKFQILNAERLCSKGLQADIFCNDTEDKCLWRGWNCELHVSNPKNGEKVKVAYGVINYIRKYGFYEGGGKDNPYRIDPIRLSAVLTGHSYDSIERSLGLRK